MPANERMTCEYGDGDGNCTEDAVSQCPTKGCHCHVCETHNGPDGIGGVCMECYRDEFLPTFRGATDSTFEDRERMELWAR
jgi:hypothetical protein